MPRTAHTYDLLILGGGTAGLTALQEARRYTDNVVMVNDGPVLTTCAHTGCMPSKSLIQAANLYASHKRMAEMGIKGAQALYPDMPSILKAVREKRDRFVQSTQRQAGKMREHILDAQARLESETSIRVDSRLMHAKAMIISTGSSPVIPVKYQDYMPNVITTDTLFECKDIPKRVAVIGLGPVGLEVAQALAQLNVEVTAIAPERELTMVRDKKIRQSVMETLGQQMTLWLDSDPDISRTDSGIHLQSGERETVVDALFIAAGRHPNIAQLGLKRLGLQLNQNDVPTFDPRTMQIQGRPLFIAGDATNERAILHEAADEGRRAAFHALHGAQDPSARYPLMQIVFTHPQIAIIGETTETAQDDPFVTGEANFESQGRAIVEQVNEGRLRVFADKQGYFRGAEMMVPAAEHLAHFLALAVSQYLTIEDILSTPFYHPTLEEGLSTALKRAQKKL